MNKYKIFFKMFLILCLSSNLFANVNENSLEQQEKTENESIVYQNSEKDSSERTEQKNIDKQKEEKEHFISDHEKKLEKYLDKKQESASKSADNKKSVQYNITGLENVFKLSDKELKHVYNIEGTETTDYSKKISLTKYQKEQLKYLEMERKYKTLVLDNEINLKKKMLSEELANDFSDVFLIDELSKNIKSLAVDRETVDINVEKKIRYVLSQEQYLQYKQNKKNQKKIIQ